MEKSMTTPRQDWEAFRPAVAASRGYSALQCHGVCRSWLPFASLIFPFLLGILFCLSKINVNERATYISCRR
jgi:hypothetical protein